MTYLSFQKFMPSVYLTAFFLYKHTFQELSTHFFHKKSVLGHTTFEAHEYCGTQPQRDCRPHLMCRRQSMIIDKYQKKCQEVKIMASNNNSGSNRMAVPEAKEAMKRFKEEVASELGVPLKDGYNGDLTSKQAGSIGGEMVKKMIMKQEQQMQ